MFVCTRLKSSSKLDTTDGRALRLETVDDETVKENDKEGGDSDSEDSLNHHNGSLHLIIIL